MFFFYNLFSEKNIISCVISSWKMQKPNFPYFSECIFPRPTTLASSWSWVTCLCLKIHENWIFGYRSCIFFLCVYIYIPVYGRIKIHTVATLHYSVLPISKVSCPLNISKSIVGSVECRAVFAMYLYVLIRYTWKLCGNYLLG